MATPNPYQSPATVTDDLIPQPASLGTSDGRICSLMACVVATIALTAPIPALQEMASYPPGTAMRPMGAVAAVFLGSLGGLFLSVPVALLGLFVSRHSAKRDYFGYLALLLGILAVIGQPTMLEFIISTRGYVLKE